MAKRDYPIIPKFEEIAEDVEREFIEAVTKYDVFNSLHEGFAVLKEEVDELWDEVRKKPETRNMEDVRKEAIQIAAMAFRIVADLC